jgi:hypothetical protein
MLVFILALQSPEASKDWVRVSQLCERTLRSVCAQTSHFRAFLVCNVRPKTDFTHPNLSIIERDFPIPSATSAARMNDKWDKLKVGLTAARHLAPAHVMLMDADDCVHRDLAAHVNRNPGAIGWLMTKGYIWDEGSRWLYQANYFFKLCGSSAIIRLSEHDFPESDLEPADRFFVLANGHSTIADHMAKYRDPLQSLPFIGSVYVAATGENDSAIRAGGWQGKRHMFRKLITARPITNRIRYEFGLYDL